MSPRCGEHLGIVHRGLPDQIFAVAPQTFGYVHGVRVEISAFTEPAVLDEIGNVNHQGIFLPVGYGISVVGRIRVLAVRRGHRWG